MLRMNKKINKSAFINIFNWHIDPMLTKIEHEPCLPDKEL